MPERVSDRIANLPVTRLRRVHVPVGAPWPPVSGGKILHVAAGEATESPIQPGLWVYYAEADERPGPPA